jgi:hypothetical protein
MGHRLGSTLGSRLLWGCSAALLTAAVGLSTPAWGRTNGSTVARASRTVSLVETAHMEFSKEEIAGTEISERGRATGTYDAPITAGLDFHAKHVTAIVTIFLKGGAITATALADFEQRGSTGTFHGTLTIAHGTGTYRHASGKLGLKGGFNHETLKMWVVTSGSGTY